MLASEASSLLSSGRLGFFPIPFEVSPKGELSRATTEAMKYTTATATKSVHSQTAGRVLQSDTCILQQPPYSSPPALNISAASLPIFQSPGYCSFYQLQTPVIGHSTESIQLWQLCHQFQIPFFLSLDLLGTYF